MPILGFAMKIVAIVAIALLVIKLATDIYLYFELAHPLRNPKKQEMPKSPNKAPQLPPMRPTQKYTYSRPRNRYAPKPTAVFEEIDSPRVKNNFLEDMIDSANLTVKLFNHLAAVYPHVAHAPELKGALLAYHALRNRVQSFELYLYGKADADTITGDTLTILQERLSSAEIAFGNEYTRMRVFAFENPIGRSDKKNGDSSIYFSEKMPFSTIAGKSFVVNLSAQFDEFEQLYGQLVDFVDDSLEDGELEVPEEWISELGNLSDKVAMLRIAMMRELQVVDKEAELNYGVYRVSRRLASEMEQLKAYSAKLKKFQDTFVSIALVESPIPEAGTDSNP